MITFSPLHSIIFQSFSEESGCFENRKKQGFNQKENIKLNQDESL